MMINKIKSSFLAALIFAGNYLFSQQIADSSFRPDLPNPAYDIEKGPVIFIDEGHHNFHTKDGRYKPFASLLERDGYIVKGYHGEFTQVSLAKAKILVISNALNEINAENWYIPVPSAFTVTEQDVVRQWVSEGGSLFLIADHMPLAGAAAELAAVFGFGFTNGFVLDTNKSGPDYFSLADSTLHDCLLTKGRNTKESVDNILSFTGQGFSIPADATPVLTFKRHYVNFIPDTAWVFTAETPRTNAEGLSQGAYKEFGKGRVVVFGEAAMFTAQLAGPNRARIGMNSESAGQNYQLLLNIIHWLDRKL